MSQSQHISQEQVTTAMRLDAARYRFLRDFAQRHGLITMDGVIEWRLQVPGWVFPRAQTFDDAVDAAMQAPILE